jgi:hypothetical protein
MEEKEERGGAVRVGMIWGGIGGVVGLLVSLLGSLVGILVAGFIGFSCGRRAAVAGNRAGALSGLVGAAGIATTLSDMLGRQVSADQAWIYFLFSLVLSGILEAAVLILVSSAAGAWAKRE